MSAETVLEARLRARDDGLVGQLNAAEQRARGAAGGLDQLATSARGAAAATATTAAADREAARAAKEVERARKDQERASKAAARAEKEAADAIARAQARNRAGQMQIGQQFQDFFIQLEGGTPFLRAFSQQASQMQGAIALLGGEVNGTSSRFAKFAAFMGGPFGIALGVGIPLAAALASKLFENADASAAAEAGANGLASAQSVLGQIFDSVSGKLKTQNELLIINARLQAISLRADAAKAEANARSATDRLLNPGNLDSARLYGQFVGSQQYGGDPKQFSNILANRRQLGMIAGGVEAGRITRADAVKMTESIDFKGTGFNQAEVTAAFRDGAVAELNRRAADLIEQSLDSGKLATEFRTKGPKGRTPSKGGGANALANFGDSAAEKIARIADGYNPAPRGLDKAFTDLRQLDGLIEDLGKRKPPSFEKLIGEAKQAREAVMAGLTQPLDDIQQRLVPLPDGIVKAKTAIEELDGVIAVLSDRKPPNWEQLVARAKELKIVAADTVNGPFNDMIRAAREQREQQLLILAGREREAAVLAKIQSLQERGVPITAKVREGVEQTVAAEERINDLLAKRQDIISIYMASIGDLRGALEDLFSGGSAGDFFKNIQRSIKQLQGRLLVESLFGDSLRALEKKVRGKSPLDREIEDLAKQVNGLEGGVGKSSAALKLFTDAVAGATARINGTVAPTSIGNGAKSFLDVFAGAQQAGAGDEIVVTGSRARPIGGQVMKEQTDFLRDLAGAIYNPFAKLFDQFLGAKFFQKLSPALQGGVAGYLTAGPVGGILGALKEFPGLPDKLKEKLGGAFEGAQTGTFVAGIGKALGLKMSTTGAQVGGAIGAALPIPGGDIIGSVLGGFVGGLFKKTPRASATITSADGDAVITGSKKYQQAAGEAAESVQGVLKSIADQLGGELGNFSVSIGKSGDSWHVDPTGRGRLKKSQGGLDFNDDYEAAVMAAAFDAIGDGGIKGLSAAVMKALKSSSDIDKAVKEALKVREVEEIVTGLGGALERQFREFETQAKERVRIATQYGFDVTKIEARNAEDRAKLVEQILASRVGSLQSLLDDLKFGDLFEGTAADRRSKLLTEIATAKTDAEKGVDGAADKLAELQRRLVETSREAYGTAGGEYAADRANAISTAEAIIAAENERIRAAQQATVDTAKAMQTQNQLTNEGNDILSEIRTLLRSGGIAGIAASAVQARASIARSVDL